MTEPSVQAMAQDWAGLTSQGRVLISLDQVKAGHPVSEIVAHERVHAVLIRNTELGWVLNTLATFAVHPWHVGDVRDRCHALLSVVMQSTRWTQEAVATFLAGLPLEGDDFASYQRRQPRLYLRAAAELDWLRPRGLDLQAKADIAMLAGTLACGVPVLQHWEGLGDIERARGWFAEPQHRPDARFPLLCRAFGTLDDAELMGLAADPPAAVAMAARLVAMGEGVPEFRLLAEDTGVDDVATIVRTVTTPLLADESLSAASRQQLADAVRVPQLALRGWGRSRVSMLMTRTRGGVGRFARDPGPDELAGYDLVTLQYNASFDVEPGLTPSGAEPMPLLPREAVGYFSGPGLPPLAATFSAFAFLDWLDTLGSSGAGITVALVDTSYLTLGRLLPPMPVLHERRHVVLVNGRTPYDLALDVKSSAEDDATVLVTVYASELVGVSYVMLRIDPAVVVMPTVAEAAREMVTMLTDSAAPTFRLVGPQEFFGSRESLADVMRVIADFEGSAPPVPAPVG